VVRLSAIRTGCHYLPESIPGTRLFLRLGRKGYINETFQWHYRESNPRSASSTCATACARGI